MLLPVFNAHMGTETRIDLKDPLLYLFMVAIIIVTCLMAGTIPALKLTTIGITDTLSGRFKREQLTLLRKLLVVFQFTASICLLVIVLFISKHYGLSRHMTWVLTTKILSMYGAGRLWL